MNGYCFSASAKRKSGRSDIIGVISWALHWRHMEYLRLSLLRNLRRPMIKNVCCRCALTNSVPMCWQLLLWVSWTINWVTWSLISSIMGCFWFQGIGACVRLPLVRKTAFSSKTGLSWRTASLGFSYWPLCILLIVFLELFCCKIFIR